MAIRNALAQMGRKKKFAGRYLVLVGCPVCDHKMVVTFAGWNAIKCQGKCPDTFLYRSQKRLEQAPPWSSE